MRALRFRLIVAATLTAPIFVVEMGGHLIPAVHHWTMSVIGEARIREMSFLLASAVLVGPGPGFFTKGIPALLRRRPT